MNEIDSSTCELPNNTQDTFLSFLRPFPAILPKKHLSYHIRGGFRYCACASIPKVSFLSAAAAAAAAYAYAFCPSCPIQMESTRAMEMMSNEYGSLGGDDSDVWRCWVVMAQNECHTMPPTPALQDASLEQNSRPDESEGRHLQR
jgi:hypothetical protein